jgi:rhomboid protease GluP
MAHGSRVCRGCGRLNSADDKACYNCGKRLPGPLTGSALSWFTDFSEDGLPATKLVAGLCILVYGLMMAVDAAAGVGPADVLWGFKASTSVRFGSLVGLVIQQEPWRVLSAVFLHGNILHLGMNMLSLINLGRTLEPHYRSARFLLMFVLCGALGFCATILWRGDSARSVGASGAIFGLLGAFIGALIVRRNPGWQNVFISNLIMAAALAFMFPNVDNAAHAGGFVVGVVLGVLLELERQPRRRDGVVTWLAGLGGLAAVASIVLSTLSPVWKVVRELERERDERHER